MVTIDGGVHTLSVAYRGVNSCVRRNLSVAREVSGVGAIFLKGGWGLQRVGFSVKNQARIQGGFVGSDEPPLKIVDTFLCLLYSVDMIKNEPTNPPLVT